MESRNAAGILFGVAMIWFALGAAFISNTAPIVAVVRFVLIGVVMVLMGAFIAMVGKP